MNEVICIDGWNFTKKGQCPKCAKRSIEFEKETGFSKMLAGYLKSNNHSDPKGGDSE